MRANQGQRELNVPTIDSMKTLLERFVRETHGQDLIEYAMLAATISLGVTAALMLVQDQLNSKFSSIGNSITAAS